MSRHSADHNGLSLLEASKLVGLTKVSILKAIQRGRLTANKDDTGQWVISAAELFRVYKPVAKSDDAVLQEPLTNNTDLAVLPTDSQQLRLAVLEAELLATKERLADTKERLEDTIRQRDQWQSQAQTLLLTDNRQKSFFQKLLGK
jgi:hypothetical protein